MKAFFLLCTLTLFAFSNTTLKLLVWEGYAPKKQQKLFESYILKKYKQSITLQINYARQPEDFYLAVRNKNAHIVTPAHNIFYDARFELINKNLLLEIDTTKLSNFTHVKDALKYNPQFYKRNALFAVPFAHGAYFLIYNQERVPQPSSWNVLWQEHAQKRYIVNKDYDEANIYVNALAMSLPSLTEFQVLNTPKFKKRLTQLAKNAYSLWEGVDKAQDLQTLDYGVVWGFSLPELNKTKTLWRIANPKEGNLGWIDAYALSIHLKENTFLKQVALEWLNFTLSKTFQEEVVLKHLGASSVTKEVKETFLAEDKKAVYNNILFWPTMEHIRNRNGIRLLWQNALKNAGLK